MPTVHYYGKKSTQVGKTLFEILANLRNFGVNRMILKQEELMRNPGQKCYYIVKKVEPIMDEKLQEGAIYAERIFRNAKVPGLVFIDDESWHTDWQLVPKDQEGLHRIKPDELVEHGHISTIRLLPGWMEVPPLLDIFLRRHFKARGGFSVNEVETDSPLIRIKMHYDLARMNKPHEVFRVVKKGEKADFNYGQPMKTLLFDQFKVKKSSQDNKSH